MSAVMTAMFNDCGAAQQVLLELIRDGFPTDRVDLTSDGEPGRAGLAPAQSTHDRFVRHFRAIFTAQEEQPLAERLAEGIEHGAAAVTVHPRGAHETMRAHVILVRAHPVELVEHDMANQSFEHAASLRETPWLRNFWIEESEHRADCIYCRLFEHS
ncbi:MAG TPA: hypothetical protein VEV18_03440 [Steroidobacteraceae bacterium]|nr:hypothetical protein [Steroidobacteraceae bacterium]